MNQCPDYRPCPHLLCRKHLWFLFFCEEGSSKYQGRKFARMSDNEILAFLWDLPYTCEVDVMRKYSGVYHNFSSGVTLECLGRIMGVTRERIRQIQEKALRKLARRTHWKRFKPWLDHRQDSYGSDGDPYGQYLPDLVGVPTKTIAGNTKWQELYGDCQKPRGRK